MVLVVVSYQIEKIDDNFDRAGHFMDNFQRLRRILRIHLRFQTLCDAAKIDVRF
jgi:hypothetical protein